MAELIWFNLFVKIDKPFHWRHQKRDGNEQNENNIFNSNLISLKEVQAKELYLK